MHDQPVAVNGQPLPPRHVTAYITMELLQDAPMPTILKRHGQLSLRDVCRMGMQLATGLQFAHADIYALGVTLFELVTGRLPFEDGDVAYKHSHAPPPGPRERVEGIPDDLAELLLHMLAKSPDDRCGSASRVAERLQHIDRNLG